MTVQVGEGDAATTSRIPARTVLWGAGVVASSFARKVALAVGVETDKAGRVLVTPELTIPGHPEIFVVGDAAVQPWKPDRATPGVAQGAMQGGRHAARTIRRRILGRPTEPFRYSNHGDVAVIGRRAGVTDIPWMGPFGQQGGITAWLLWSQWRARSSWAAAAGFASSMFVLLFLSRVFQTSYLLWPLSGIGVALLLASAPGSAAPSASAAAGTEAPE